MKKSKGAVRKRVIKVMSEDEGHVVNENGVLLEDLIMCSILGIKEIPKGFHVKHRNGNTLDNCSENLELVKN
jgi:HNH endonuclease